MATYYVATTGNDTTGDGSVGNPYATPGKALGVAIAAATAGYIIYVKAGTYAVTTATANVAGGVLNFTLTGTQLAWNRMEGYTTTVGDGGRFTLALGAGLAATVVTLNNANSFNILKNVAITGNATSGAAAATIQGRSNRVRNLKVSGGTGGGNHLVSVGNNGFLENFEISGGATGAFAALNIVGAVVRNGWVHGNAGRGVDFGATSVPSISRIASADHTGTQGYGFHFQSTNNYALIECVAWNNAQSNFFLQNADVSLDLIDCISGNAGGYDFDNRSGPDAITLTRCAAKTSTSGLYPVTPNHRVDFVTLTVAPFTAYATGNFSLNNTSGGGAGLRGVAGTLFPDGQTTYDADYGLGQEQGSSGGGSIFDSPVIS